MNVNIILNELNFHVALTLSEFGDITKGYSTQERVNAKSMQAVVGPTNLTLTEKQTNFGYSSINHFEPSFRHKHLHHDA